jgi:hypothetical protein
MSSIWPQTFLAKRRIDVGRVAGWMGLALLGLSGCGSSLNSSYGELDAGANISPNGLGVHRNLWQQAGVDFISIKRLSNRLNKVDSLVLVSTDFQPPSQLARKWLEEWLRAAPGRSIIYFGRDFNAREYYLKQLNPSSGSEQEAYIRKQIALLRADELRRRNTAYLENTSCDWFYLDVHSSPTIVTGLSGSWAGNLKEYEPVWPIRTRLLPPATEQQGRLPSWLSSKATGVATPANAAPAQNNDAVDQNKTVYRTQWENDEIKTIEEWSKVFADLPRSQVLLESASGEPLVFKLVHPERFGDGQIIVCANGAPFLNASLVQPAFGQIAELIIGECLPSQRVAFLPIDENGLQVAPAETDSRGLGLEMLVQWPLAVVTMPACLVALIVCVSLLPILGRPRELPKNSVSDFGMHVEALGEMLYDTRDQAFALRAVRHYFIKVRNEQPPKWLGDEHSRNG